MCRRHILTFFFTYSSIFTYFYKCVHAPRAYVGGYMRKKISLLFILVLVVLVACTLVACDVGSQFVDKAPETINDADVQRQNENLTGGSYSLIFSFVKMSTIFAPVQITPEEGYDIGLVSYQVSYKKDAYSSITGQLPMQLEYIDEESRPLLSQPGHHTIKVSIPYAGQIIKGAFSLHLLYEYDEVNYANVTIDLNGGNAVFTNAVNGKAKSIVAMQDVDESGTKCAKFTWIEFLRSFYITKAECAVKEFTYGSNKTFSSANEYVYIYDDTTFKAIWTKDAINVTFQVDAPKDSRGKAASTYAQLVVPTKQTVQRSLGYVIRPDSNGVNVYNGYFFSGWYTTPDFKEGSLWSFTSTVDVQDFTLYARYVTRYYTSTIYPMGGKFASNINTTIVQPAEGVDPSVYITSKGYHEAKVNVSYGPTGTIDKIETSGLIYGERADTFAAVVQVSPDPADTKIMLVSEFIANITRNDSRISLENLYTSQACKESERATVATTVNGDGVFYLKWTFDIGASGQNSYDLDKISDIYSTIIFKNGMSLNADGTVSIDKISDFTVNEIVVPATIKYQGIERKVTKIADKALMNARFLGKVDLSKAVNLTEIGKEAFANCTNLYSIIWPTPNAINYIGKSAFVNTEYEDSIDNDYIIINGIIYKYKGENVATIDLTTINEIVTTIGVDAFAKVSDLELIKLQPTITTICEGAFADLALLKCLDIPADSALCNVSNNAFNGCETLFGNESSNVVQIYGQVGDSPAGKVVDAVKFGPVLYRILNEDAKQVDIKVEDGFKVIGENCFDKCEGLTTINFENVTKIEKIGENAFANTKDLIFTFENPAEPDIFVAYNGILAEYFCSDYYYYNAVIPSGIKVIGARSFNSYARYIKTLQIGENVEKIEDYAFAGATNLTKFIFTHVTVSGGKLVNAPAISAYSFANSKGKLITDAQFFFNQEVINYLKSNNVNDADKAWADFYKMYSDRFIAEQINGVWINTNVVPTTFVRTTTGSYDSWKIAIENELLRQGKSSAEVASIVTSTGVEKGLVVVSSAGVEKYEFLLFSYITDSFISYEGSNYGVTQLTYPTADPSVIHNSRTKAHFYEYSVVYAITGNPQMYSASTNAKPIAGETLSSSTNYWVQTLVDPVNNIWEDGLVGDVAGSIPTFYTSTTSIDKDTIRLAYLPVGSTAPNYKYLPASSISGFSPLDKTQSTLIITFDFNDVKSIGQYRISFTYKGAASKYVEVSQASSVSVPLNAVASNYFNTMRVEYAGQDGRIIAGTYGQNFRVVSVNGVTTNELPTNELGIINVRAQYIGNYATVDSKMYLDFCYSIVLEGDASQFVFDVKGNHAIVTSHSAKNVDTLVIPSTYTQNGVMYEVTEIGKEAFKGYTNLSTVYLPSTLTKIGDAAFSGCTALKYVYTASSIDNVGTPIDDANFEILSKTIHEEAYVNVTGVDIVSGDIVLPEIVTIESYDNTGAYPITTTVDAYPLLDATKNIFENVTGTIYLDYTEANVLYAKQYLRTKTVVFMVYGSTPKDENVEYVFYNANGIKYVVEQRAAQEEHNAAVIASGEGTIDNTCYFLYYLVTGDNPRKEATAQRHFTIDNTSIDVINSDIIVDRKLVGLTGVDFTNTNSVVVAYQYVVEGDHTRTVNNTVGVGTTININVGKDIIVHLPNTIMNDCTFVNAQSYAVEKNIYEATGTLIYTTDKCISNGIEYIGASAFYGCKNLTELDLTSATALEYIGSAAFAQSAIMSIDLSKTKITEINSQTFYGCELLAEVVFALNKVTYVGDSAFYGCRLLTDLPTNFGSVKTIGSNAFLLCTGLSNITLTSTVTYVGDSAFSDENLTITLVGCNTANWASNWAGLSIVH